MDTPFAVAIPANGDTPPLGRGGSCSHFVDVADDRGVRHVYLNGEAGRSLMVEAIGGGAGWLDYDRDGQWDLYLVQGGDPAAVDRGDQPTDQLFRNGGSAGFVDVSAAAVLIAQGYGQGVAIGDYDDDGFDDIYVTNVGRNALYRNLGDGTFLDVTTEAGVGDPRWSSSAAWADLDGDGDLDLYVCNYLDYDPLKPLDCRNAVGEPRICHPRDIDAVPDECFLNQGDGTFRASAVALGLHGPGNKALGVAVADFTGDGLPDIYVANDTEPNFLFRQRGDGTYDEVALALGCAVDRDGNAQASMGVAAGDYDADGVLDLYVTHFHDDSNTLYRGLGAAGFEDITALVGLHGPTLDRLGFGAVMADFDADSHMELLVANGHIENYPGNPLLTMRPQLFEWQA
ncbi:MAG: VCBS repeat-containing protein, partial [Planctomycetota bacterium]|nr:VCBS repeat-containing protein [Planctomycetota bacterium]